VRKVRDGEQKRLNRQDAKTPRFFSIPSFQYPLDGCARRVRQEEQKRRHEGHRKNKINDPPRAHHWPPLITQSLNHLITKAWFPIYDSRARWNGCILSAGEDGEAFKEKVNRLTATLREWMAEACKLDTVIETNLKELGYVR